MGEKVSWAACTTIRYFSLPAANTEAENSDFKVVSQDENSSKDSDELSRRRTRSIAEIYEKCNVVFPNPTSYTQAYRSKGWIQAMNEEMTMIEKNKT